MAGFDDIAKKAQGLMADERVKKAIKSEQAEGISDRVLDATEHGANAVSGKKFGTQIGGARDAADKHIGDK